MVSCVCPVFFMDSWVPGLWGWAGISAGDPQVTHVSMQSHGFWLDDLGYSPMKSSETSAYLGDGWHFYDLMGHRIWCVDSNNHLISGGPKSGPLSNSHVFKMVSTWQKICSWMFWTGDFRPEETCLTCCATGWGDQSKWFLDASAQRPERHPAGGELIWRAGGWYQWSGPAGWDGSGELWTTYRLVMANIAMEYGHL